MFASTLGTMVGIIPIAMTGGVVMGLTKEAIAIPEATSGRRRRKGQKNYRNEADTYWAKTFGPPDKSAI